MKRINIYGLSSYGYYLAKSLSNKNIEIVTIDLDEMMIDEVKDFVHKPLIGDATKIELLRELQVSETDYNVVSLGEKMEASILCTLHLKELKAKNIYAKANNLDHAKILMKVGADQIVFPEKDIAEETAEKLANPDVIDLYKITHDFSMVEIPPLIQFEGKDLKAINLPRNFKLTIILIKNVLSNEVFMPMADYKIKSGDVFYLLGKNKDLDKYKDLLKN